MADKTQKPTPAKGGRTRSASIMDKTVSVKPADGFLAAPGQLSTGTNPPISALPQEISNVRERSDTINSEKLAGSSIPSVTSQNSRERSLFDSFYEDKKFSSTVEEKDSFGFFRCFDKHPRVQRKLLYALNQRHLKSKDDSFVSKVVQDQQLKIEKSNRGKINLGGKLNALLRNKKPKKTGAGAYHLLMLCIHDFRVADAMLLLETISEQTMVKKRPFESNRVFLTAMASKMEGICLQMLEKGFPSNVNSPIFGVIHPDKFTFPSYFQVAVSFQLFDVVKAMIKLKADVNVSWYQLTPLHNACVKGNDKLVGLLLENGANINQGLGLEDHFLLSRLKQPKELRRTTATGTKLMVTDIFTQSGSRGLNIIPPEYCAGKFIYPFELAYAKGHISLAFALLEQTSPQVIIGSQFGLLLSQDFKFSKLLLKNGADLTTRDPLGCSPLHLAARAGNTQLLMVLLKAQANINEKGLNDWTPLHEAAINGHAESVHYLLSKGADLGAKTNTGLTAKELAASKFEKSIVTVLFSNPPEVTSFLEKEQSVSNAELVISSLGMSPKVQHKKGLGSFLKSNSSSNSSLNSKSKDNITTRKSFFSSTKSSKSNN